MQCWLAARRANFSPYNKPVLFLYSRFALFFSFLRDRMLYVRCLEKDRLMTVSLKGSCSGGCKEETH